MIIRKLEEGRLWLFLAGRPPRRQEKRSSRARCMFFLCIKYNSGKIIKLARKDHHQHSPDSTWRRRQMFQSRRVIRERITSKLTWGSFSWSSLSSSSIASPFSAFWGKTWFSRFSCKQTSRPRGFRRKASLLYSHHHHHHQPRNNRLTTGTQSDFTFVRGHAAWSTTLLVIAIK